jgi:large subunit ribosomal protein L18
MRKKILDKKKSGRIQRKKRIRNRISGTVNMPRLTIFKSNKYFYAQAIDDVAGNTLSSINGKKEGLKANKTDVVKLAEKFSVTLKEKGIEKVVFDRNGYLYHGVIASFANGLRDNGISL